MVTEAATRQAVRVAVAQVTAGADVAGNVRRTCDLAAQAAAQGARVIVLPETVTTGWIMEPEVIRTASEPGDGTGVALSAWRATARAHGIAIVGGYVERAGDRVYNAVATIDRGGELRGAYRKLHLFGAEREQFAPGDLGLPVFELDGLKLGVLVCYDLRFPEALRLLALQGAELVAVPTAWVVGFDPGTTPDSGRIGQVDGVLVQANLNQVYVACADLAGDLRGSRFLGRSLVASPYGTPLAGPLPADGEALAFADVEPERVRAAHARGDGISPRANRRTDVYALELAGASRRTDRQPIDGAALVEEIKRTRGYVLELHRTLATRDPEFLAAYDQLLDAAFLRERSLDRRIKELVYVGVLAALGTSQAHLEAHMRAAIEHGATERELLEVLEQIFPAAGVPRFDAALEVFTRTFGADRGDDEQRVPLDAMRDSARR